MGLTKIFSDNYTEILGNDEEEKKDDDQDAVNFWALKELMKL